MMNLIKALLIALFWNPANKDTSKLGTQKRLDHLGKLMMFHQRLVKAHHFLHRISFKLPIYLIEPLAEKAMDKMYDEAAYFGGHDADVEARQPDAWFEHTAYFKRHPVLKFAYTEAYVSRR